MWTFSDFLSCVTTMELCQRSRPNLVVPSSVKTENLRFLNCRFIFLVPVSERLTSVSQLGLEFHRPALSCWPWSGRGSVVTLHAPYLSSFLTQAERRTPAPATQDTSGTPHLGRAQTGAAAVPSSCRAGEVSEIAAKLATRDRAVRGILARFPSLTGAGAAHTLVPRFGNALRCDCNQHATVVKRRFACD